MEELEQLGQKYDLATVRPSDAVVAQVQESIPGRGLDLSKVTPEQFKFLQQQDPGALQRGAARFAQQGTAAPPQQPDAAAVDLRAMLAAYAPSRDSKYGQEVESARTNAKRETDAFNQMVQQALQQPAGGPSKAEMYFRLAAAFGSPTKTGAFGETLAGAANTMAEFKKEERAAASADRASKLQLGLTAAKARADAANTDLSTVRTLASEEMRADRATQGELLKQYLASGKPQSEAGKRAMDTGLRPGTPEYAKFVQDDIKANLEKGDWYKELTAAIAAQTLALNQRRLENQEASSKKLTPKEVQLKTETEELVGASEQAALDLAKAFQLNEIAFDASLIDKAQRAALEAVGSKDPKVAATREMENLLSKGAVAKLRSAFGGNPTEGERNILLSLEGIDAKSKEERKQIMANAYKALKTNLERQRKRLADINAGAYRDAAPLPEELK